MASSWVPIGLACGGVAYVVAETVLREGSQHQLPPGPTKLPLLGNVLDLKNGLDWEKFAEFSKQYDSDVIHLSALGKSIVILNSYKAAQDLLEQRSGIYSSRPHSTMLHELSGWTAQFSFTEYNDSWRAARRMFTKHFRLANTDLSQPREIYYVRRFLNQILEKPDDFRHHIQQWASCISLEQMDSSLTAMTSLIGSISISMTYGLKTRPVGDPHIALAEEAGQVLSDTAIKNYLVDVLPFLKHVPAWVPGAGFQTIAANNKRLIDSVKNDTFEAAKLNMETTDYSPSFVSEALQDLELLKNQDEELDLMKEVATQVYLAAADTTNAYLSTFFLAMVIHPEVQKKLQQELDTVLQGRLPVHEDIDSLPYLNAVLLEVLRWEVAVPVAIPHLVIMDDVYNGYHIPKGSIVIPNQWAMLTDPEVYPEPMQFKPERFLKDGKINDAVRSPTTSAFGFGRRECPGRHIALSTLRMTMASVLSSFDILKKKDAAGKVIQPTRDYPFSLIRHPKDIICDIRPRSSSAEKGIRSWASVEGEHPP